jgi:hypothetical protein
LVEISNSWTCIVCLEKWMINILEYTHFLKKFKTMKTASYLFALNVHFAPIYCLIDGHFIGKRRKQSSKNLNSMNENYLECHLFEDLVEVYSLFSCNNVVSSMWWRCTQLLFFRSIVSRIIHRILADNFDLHSDEYS